MLNIKRVERRATDGAYERIQTSDIGSAYGMAAVSEFRQAILCVVGEQADRAAQVVREIGDLDGFCRSFCFVCEV